MRTGILACVRVSGVAQAIAHEVEGEHRDDDEDHRREDPGVEGN